MDDKIAISMVLPTDQAEIASRFLRMLAYPVEGGDGKIKPPPFITIVGPSGVAADYMVEQTAIKPRSFGPDSTPNMVLLKAVAIPVHRAGNF